jgi:hypothetical protein
MAAAWAPAAADVKALLPQRGGGDTFTDETIPSLTQVRSIIDQVVTEVLAHVGGVLPPGFDLEPHAARAAMLGAAYYVELGLFPEQANDGGSAAEQLHDRYTEALARLLKLVTDVLARTQPAPGFASAPVESAVVAAYRRQWDLAG